MKTTNNHPFTAAEVQQMLAYTNNDLSLAITYLYEELEFKNHLG